MCFSASFRILIRKMEHSDDKVTCLNFLRTSGLSRLILLMYRNGPDYLISNLKYFLKEI